MCLVENRIELVGMRLDLREVEEVREREIKKKGKGGGEKKERKWVG